MDKPLREVIRDDLGVNVGCSAHNSAMRGWKYRGVTDHHCTDCGSQLHVAERQSPSHQDLAVVCAGSCLWAWPADAFDQAAQHGLLKRVQELHGRAVYYDDHRRDVDEPFSVNAWYSADTVRDKFGFEEDEFQSCLDFVLAIYRRSLDPDRRFDRTLLHGTEIGALLRQWETRKSRRDRTQNTRAGTDVIAIEDEAVKLATLSALPIGPEVLMASSCNGHDLIVLEGAGGYRGRCSCEWVGLGPEIGMVQMKFARHCSGFEERSVYPDHSD